MDSDQIHRKGTGNHTFEDPHKELQSCKVRCPRNRKTQVEGSLTIAPYSTGMTRKPQKYAILCCQHAPHAICRVYLTPATLLNILQLSLHSATVTSVISTTPSHDRSIATNSRDGTAGSLDMLHVLQLIPHRTTVTTTVSMPPGYYTTDPSPRMAAKAP